MFARLERLVTRASFLVPGSKPTMAFNFRNVIAEVHVKYHAKAARFACVNELGGYSSFID